MRYTREDLKALQAATLDEKIDHSLSMIEIFYLREHGNCYISFSGGKDSTVLKYLIEHEYPARGGRLLQNIPSVFSDTGLEYPEIRKFAMRQENVVSVRPKMNFLEVLRHYGYPLISKAVSNAIVNAKRTPGGSRWKRMHGEYRRNDGGRSQFDYSKWLPLMDLPIKISDECCGAMKKRPMQTYQRATGRYPITGTTAAENGIFDHTPDHAAPFGTLARYGYLLSLTDGPVARAFEEYKRRVGVPQHAAVSDKQRYAFENEYIAIAREKAAARKLIRFPGGQGGKEKPRAR